MRFLKEKAGLEDEVSSDDLGFRLAPRINAAGRLQTAELALRLILDDGEEGEKLAHELEILNFERQKLTSNIITEVEVMISRDLDKEKILIAYNPNWPLGVIGLVAGRLAEQYARPCIIMEDRGDELVASARSPEFFDLMEYLPKFKNYLSSFGGHKQAAGFSLPKKYLENFEHQFQ